MTNRERRARLGYVRIAAAYVTLCAAQGCDRVRHDRAHQDAPKPEARTFLPSPVDTLWTYPASVSGSLGTPEFLATDGSLLYVGDTGRHVVVALDAQTGARRWTSAPDMIASPMALAPRRSGGVIVFDAERRALVVLDARGRVGRRIATPSLDLVHGMCELPDSSMLVAGPGADVLWLGDTGRPLGARALPWPDLRAASSLVTASVLAPTPDGCVVALMLGRGFARFARGAFGARVSYVERVELPPVRRTTREIPNGTVTSESLGDHTIAAQDLAAAGSDVFVAFGGRTADAAHLIDRYDTSGVYRGTYRTGTRVQAIAVTDTALMLLTYRAGEPVVVALRRPRGNAASLPTP